MKTKQIVVAVSAAFAFAIVINMAKPPDSGSPSPDPIEPDSQTVVHNQDNNKTVTANDEQNNSKPYQVSVKDKSQFIDKIAINDPTEKPKYFTFENKSYPLRKYQTLALPNDPFASQWWVANSKLDEAWDIPRGPNNTLLAVIDTGFALNHQEFDNRWYVNSGESGATGSENPSSLNCTDQSVPLDASCNLIDDDFNGIIDDEFGATIYENPSRLNCSDQSMALDKNCNRIDDDSNGLIDDTSGWDFINNDNLAQAGELNPTGRSTTHGTLVTGIAAATGGNGVGIAGVDWGTEILPIQAMDDDGYGDTLSVGRSILYAIDRGADVITISLGTLSHDQFVLEAIEQAVEAGIVVVAAAGNDGCNCMVYPARYPEVVGVGALSSNNDYASFSSYGTNLDILAPGSNLASPTYVPSNQTTAYSFGISGTSFAAPLVAGVMTTMLSHQSNAEPLQLIAALGETANRLSIPSNAAHSIRYGFGKVNAPSAINRMINARIANQTNVFDPISIGGHLFIGQPIEPLQNFNPYQCNTGIYATTPLIELKKGADRFYSISRAEARLAQTLGYSYKLISYACLQQPHDIIGDIRAMNISSELQNSFFR